MSVDDENKLPNILIGESPIEDCDEVPDEDEDDEDLDDEELEVTPQYVIDMLGFDPKTEKW